MSKTTLYWMASLCARIGVHSVTTAIAATLLAIEALSPSGESRPLVLPDAGETRSTPSVTRRA